MRYLDEAYPKAPLLGATSVMEGVRNAAAGLKGRAISGPHGYEQIPAPKEKAIITMWERRAELEGFAHRARGSGQPRGD
jgi:hypothetical protein